MFILECIYGKLNSSFPAPFLAFLYLVYKLLKSLFSPFLLVSKLYELSFWIVEYLADVAIFLLLLSLYYYCHFWLFYWSVNCTVLVSKLYLLLQTILNWWLVLIEEIFSGWDIKKGQFHFLVTFLVVFLVCKLYKPGLYILTYFEHGYFFIWDFSNYFFKYHSVFKYLKSIFSSNFSWSENVPVLVCKLYMLGL